MGRFFYYFFKIFYSLPVFDLHKHEAMSQCKINSVKHKHIYFVSRFIFTVMHVDIPVSVLRSPWKKSKVRYHSWQPPMFKCVNLTYSPVCMEPGTHKKKAKAKAAFILYCSKLRCGCSARNAVSAPTTAMRYYSKVKLILTLLQCIALTCGR